ncbi:hypothetical protein FHR92_005190 [Fontibacillus solani]|uniref:Uncharacterized protein n=1 Tax=Fontibacillus solani TaxID=1572857 RepID=A0A7W3SYT5_9BACL|nr:hypothetical protein [Fontibacillus solani]
MKSIQFKDMESLEKEIQINNVDGGEYFITVSFQKQTENQEDLVNRAYQVVYEYMIKIISRFFTKEFLGAYPVLTSLIRFAKILSESSLMRKCRFLTLVLRPFGERELPALSFTVSI